MELQIKNYENLKTREAQMEEENEMSRESF